MSDLEEKDEAGAIGAPTAEPESVDEPEIEAAAHFADIPAVEMRELRGALGHELAELRGSLTARLAGVRREFRDRIAELEKVLAGFDRAEFDMADAASEVRTLRKVAAELAKFRQNGEATLEDLAAVRARLLKARKRLAR